MQDRPPSLFDVAGQVDALIRQYDALEYCRARVHEAASEHVAHKRAAQTRESARVAFLVENGTWDALNTTRTERPAGQDVFFWSLAFRGITQLPVPEWPGPDASGQDWEAWGRAAEPFFRELQESGFPPGAHTEPDEKWYSYEFEVEAWLPKALDEPEDVGPADTPLPVPKRPVTLVGRYAGLAAVHDAHWRGSELIAPWGVNSRGDEDWPTPLLLPEDLDSSTASMWYWHQVMTAKDLGAKDATAVASWLADVSKDLANKPPKRPHGKKKAKDTCETPRARKKSKRSQEIDDLLAMYDQVRKEDPDASRQKVVNRYNSKYKTPIKGGKRKKATARWMTDVLYDRRKRPSRNQKHA